MASCTQCGEVVLAGGVSCQACGSAVAVATVNGQFGDDTPTLAPGMPVAVAAFGDMTPTLPPPAASAWATGGGAGTSRINAAPEPGQDFGPRYR
ncbi:MAG: hypothetical protein ACRD17_11160, partial [Terriglobales bacterium]